MGCPDLNILDIIKVYRALVTFLVSTLVDVYGCALESPSEGHTKRPLARSLS